MSTTTGSTIHRTQTTVTTTDATVTTCGSFTMPDESVARVLATVLGIQSASAITGGYLCGAIVEAQSGTRALVGTVSQLIEKEDTVGWDATIDVSGNDVRVRVTGVAATTIQWQATIDIIVFKP